MLNESTHRDAAHLGVLNSAAQAFELWHNAQVEAIHKRMLRRHLTDEKRLEIGGVALQAPAPQVFTDFRDIDAALRDAYPSDITDRRMLAEVRMWLHDCVTDLCNFELDHAVQLLEWSFTKLNWLVNTKSRAGARRNRLLDDATAGRLTDVIGRLDALHNEVIRVRALVAA